MDLVSRLLAGDPAALARAITLVERDRPAPRDLLAAIHPHTGRARVIGVTGPPGVGKSTLVDQLAISFRQPHALVGVLAVDPSSPFTGGAILGDRVRMARSSADPGIFIRSLATRGQLGGLSQATGDAIRLMDASGRSLILVETVGAGQAEVDIMNHAHTVLVVLAPGLGDDVQAIKAGILEIGHVFAVNKADRDGADRTAAELEMMLEMAPDCRAGGWRPPVVRTVARDGRGIPELVRKLDEHWDCRQSELDGWCRRQAAAELSETVEAMAGSRLREWAAKSGMWEEVLDAIVGRRLDPRRGAETLLSHYLDSRPGEDAGSPTGCWTGRRRNT
ncbi:MAG TPA: methylmalonyl Co-A mutase-associated GTPase MeaB [Bacillota bacterium]|nr:methylmalonyl Co-A mutase-associated GTPase MeaB [Bacillota bacterium]